MSSVKGEAPYCVLRSDESVRAAIKYRMKERGVTAAELASYTGIPPYRISLYFNRKQGWVTQGDLKKLLTYLGIEVSMKINLL